MAVQLLCCWRVDQRILFMALGIIHAIAIQAPNILNSKSVTVAIATPTDTTTRARTCIPWTNLPISFLRDLTRSYMNITHDTPFKILSFFLNYKSCFQNSQEIYFQK